MSGRSHGGPYGVSLSDDVQSHVARHNSLQIPFILYQTFITVKVKLYPINDSGYYLLTHRHLQTLT